MQINLFQVPELVKWQNQEPTSSVLTSAVLGKALHIASRAVLLWVQVSHSHGIFFPKFVNLSFYINWNLI